MREPHARFQAWLLAGAEGDPPRDLAVHASVCAACRASIAAFDRLEFVDPGAATIPSPTRPVTRGALVRAGRAVGAAFGVMIAATVLGVGGWQLIEAARGGPDGIARASGTPNQVVLAGSGTPEASQEASGSAVAASASEMPTASPSGNAPAATPRPGTAATPQPAVTPRPTATAQPTALSTPQQTVPPTGTLGASPSPTSTAGPTLTPPPVPTATPSPAPTPTPTPTPAPGAPTLVQAIWDGVSAIHLSWSAPSGGPVDYYEILRSSSTQTETLHFSPVLGTTFDDGAVATGEIWYYEVRAVGPGGTGAVSNELSETVP